MRPMTTLQDLVDEAKARTLLWAICIFAITYFLSHTSKSMWTNIPISILILSVFRYLSYEVELRWRVPPIHKQTYLSHLERKQLSINDSRLSTTLPASKWRQKIDSPPVEAAVDDFVNKILQDFVVDLWYSDISPDKEAPELIRSIILDVLGEISGRIKEINLVDLLTRDVVDLIGKHLDLYRKNQSEIGVEVMGTLSFEERDERLKHHLIASSQLHPALISPECEHKVLQRIVGGILAIVMRPQEAKSPLVRSIGRELLTCLVLQPVMNLASPAYINELIEYAFLTNKDNSSREAGVICTSSDAASLVQEHSQSGESEAKMVLASDQLSDLAAAKVGGRPLEHSHLDMEESTHHRPADWALVLEAATKRRTQVLAPENLENMWTKGRNYNKKKSSGTKKAETLSGTGKTLSGIEIGTDHAGLSGKELVISKNNKTVGIEKEHFGDGSEKNSSIFTNGSNSQLKRSSSTPDINMALMRKTGDGLVLKEPSAGWTSHSEVSLPAPKLRCRVVGAYFEKLGSKSFAVYCIAVSDPENKTWFVKRRYRNFERLHRQLKDIPNYSLHLPPKRFLSSSIDDYFVHQRCILLDKYLQDLLSSPNLAELHEVWDFFSVSSKNYSFGKYTSVMKTLAVNVDDAMDDIVRQFKDVSVGLQHAVAVASPTHVTASPMEESGMALSWHDEGRTKNSLSYTNMETSRSMTDDEGKDEDHSSAAISGWHSDNEITSKNFPPRVFKQIDESRSLHTQKSHELDQFDKFLASKYSVASGIVGDPAGMPPEWTPPNVSVPLLNLVDKMFQLNRRGWLRRQVLWISKQILQLMMEDAIDDWILRQIHCLRSDEIIAYGIRWIHNVLWPNGTFFIKLSSSRTAGNGPVKLSSFELQLEAARRASDVKKMILGGAPTALVSLIGNKQYQRCAKDIYYFLQSSLCVKHLAYSTLELVLVSIFPELRDLIHDIHDKARTKPMYEK